MARVNVTELKFEVKFGPIAAPIAQQLKLQGIKFDRDAARSWQKSADAITLLKYRGFISLQASNAARKKLYSRIMKEVSNG